MEQQLIVLGIFALLIVIGIVMYFLKSGSTPKVTPVDERPTDDSRIISSGNTNIEEMDPNALDVQTQ
jgi:hypothetical protein